LKNSLSTENLSWCREKLGIVSLDCWLRNHVTHYIQIKQ
jgi:hypothetical protein